MDALTTTYHRDYYQVQMYDEGEWVTAETGASLREATQIAGDMLSEGIRARVLIDLHYNPNTENEDTRG